MSDTIYAEDYAPRCFHLIPFLIPPTWGETEAGKSLGSQSTDHAKKACKAGNCFISTPEQTLQEHYCCILFNNFLFGQYSMSNLDP